MIEMHKDTKAELRARKAMKERRELRAEWERVKVEKLAAGRQALDRLLTMAATQHSGQIKHVALFIGACWNGRRHFDFFDFRSLDPEIQEDMFSVLLAHATGLQDIENMLPDARARIIDALICWGMYGPDQAGQPIVTRHCD